MKRLLSNPHARLFVALYALSLVVLLVTRQSLDDVLGSLVILGLFLPLVALAATARIAAPVTPTPWRRDDPAVMLALLAWIVVFLVAKGPLLAALLPAGANQQLRDTANALLKLAAFVAVPWLVLRARGFGTAEAGQSNASIVRLSLVFVIMAAAALVVQATIGSQFKRLLASDFTTMQRVVGFVLCFAWMSVEAGLVEEFFFRRYLQSRLAAWTRSEISAVLLGALVFGLAHAPGILLRGAGTMEGLGESPGALTTLAYVIATQGVAGIAFGVLWSRTRSLWLIVALHGFFDALSNSANFIETWLS